MSEGVEWSNVGALVVDLAMWSTSDFEINAELVWCLVAAIDIAIFAEAEEQQSCSGCDISDKNCYASSLPDG